MDGLRASPRTAGRRAALTVTPGPLSLASLLSSKPPANTQDIALYAKSLLGRDAAPITHLAPYPRMFTVRLMLTETFLLVTGCLARSNALVPYGQGYCVTVTSCIYLKCEYLW